MVPRQQPERTVVQEIAAAVSHVPHRQNVVVDEHGRHRGAHAHLFAAAPHAVDAPVRVPDGFPQKSGGILQRRFRVRRRRDWSLDRFRVGLADGHHDPPEEVFPEGLQGDFGGHFAVGLSSHPVGNREQGDGFLSIEGFEVGGHGEGGVLVGPPLEADVRQICPGKVHLVPFHRFRGRKTSAPPALALAGKAPPADSPRRSVSMVRSGSCPGNAITERGNVKRNFFSGGSGVFRHRRSAVGKAYPARWPGGEIFPKGA